MIRSPYDIYCGSETQFKFHLLQRALYRRYKRNIMHTKGIKSFVLEECEVIDDD